MNLFPSFLSNILTFYSICDIINLTKYCRTRWATKWLTLFNGGICMSNYLQSIRELALPIVSMHQKELIDVKLRKEFEVNIISIIIDDPETFSMDIDEVALINSELLDVVNDLIPDGYYLEVTTPGIERELQTEMDLQRAIGKYIYIKTYQKLEEYQIKEITGTLLETTENTFVVEMQFNQRKKVVTVPRTAVAKIRLAVKF